MSPFQGWEICCVCLRYPGRCPGLPYCAPMGLKNRGSPTDSEKNHSEKNHKKSRRSGIGVGFRFLAGCAEYHYSATQVLGIQGSEETIVSDKNLAKISELARDLFGCGPAPLVLWGISSVTYYGTEMTNDEIPNDERNPKPECRIPWRR